jgi:glycosyltransferase involved in cell wall biosynthesis
MKSCETHSRPPGMGFAVGKFAPGDGDSAPVNVCVVTPNFYRSSGVSVAMRAIYEATRRFNIEQSFVNCEYGNEQQDTSWLAPENVASIRLMDSNPFVVAKALHMLRGWLQKRRVSVVHVYHRRLAAILYSCKAFLGCQMVYSGQLTYPFAGWFWPVRPDRATAVSESVARNMRATMRVRDVTVVCNPVRFDQKFHTVSSQETCVDAVCVGRLEPVKGHEHLIRAWAIVRDAGCAAKLAIVGEGSLEKRLRDQVRESGLDDLIEFRGFRTDVLSEIHRGRFGILASRVEGQPIAVIEAAACGRASLVTDVDGSRDCLPPSRVLPNAVPFGNPTALAAALKLWLASPQAVQEDGKTFRTFILQKSSQDVIGAQYAKIYREVGLSQRSQ